MCLCLMFAAGGLQGGGFPDAGLKLDLSRTPRPWDHQVSGKTGPFTPPSLCYLCLPHRPYGRAWLLLAVPLSPSTLIPCLRDGAHISSCGMKSFLIVLKFGQCVTVIYLDDIVRTGHGLIMVSKGAVPRAREMAQQVKAVATKPDHLSSIPGIHTVEGGSWLLQVVLCPIYMLCYTTPNKTNVHIRLALAQAVTSSCQTFICLKW